MLAERFRAVQTGRLRAAAERGRVRGGNCSPAKRLQGRESGRGGEGRSPRGGGGKKREKSAEFNGGSFRDGGAFPAKVYFERLKSASDELTSWIDGF